MSRLSKTCHAGDMAKPAKKKAPAKKRAAPKRPTDVNQLAHFLVKATTEREIEISPPSVSDSDIKRVMAELGRRGGRIGGKKRAEGMTKERRVEIALKAARSRWDKKG